MVFYFNTIWPVLQFAICCIWAYCTNFYWANWAL